MAKTPEQQILVLTYTADDIKNCTQENIYFTFMMLSKGYRFYNKTNNQLARDKAQVFWSCNHSRDSLFKALIGTHEKWGFRL